MPDRRTRRLRLLWLVFGVTVLAPLVTVAVRSTCLTRPAGELLEIEMRATGGGAAQLFWSQDWAFYHERSTVLPLHRRPGEFETLRFPLPDRRLEHLRFDPLDGPGEVEIREVRLLDRQGRLVRRIDPLQFMPLYQIEKIAYEADRNQVRVVTEPRANDPMLLLNAAALAAPPRWWELTSVTPFWLGWVAAASAALIGVAVGCIVRDLRRGRLRPRDVLWLAALFVTVVSAKLLLLREYPMPVPFWDQWDGEGLSLYLPFSNGTLAWRQMFTLHNEHRIFFTRVLAVVLVALDRQWDPQLQIAVNAVLHATAAAVLAAVSWLALDRRWLPAISTMVLLAVAPPFAIENSLAGFQSAFYFLALFTVLALWLMTSRQPGAPGWVIGWCCAIACIFTVAGGVLTAAALAVAAVLRLFADPRAWRRSLLELAAIAVVAWLGYMALPPPLATHANLRAESTRSLVFAFTHALAFPWIARLRPAGVLWLPVAILTLAVVWRRFRSSLAERWVLALGAWIVVQAAAFAVSRGVGGNPPASRYLDMLAVGLVANLLAVLLLAYRHGGRTRRVTLASVAWLAVIAVGVTQLSARMVRVEAAERRDWMHQYVRNVGRFVTAPDLDWFLALRGPAQIPYSRPPLLAGMLTHPYIRDLLPAAVRAPIPLTAATSGPTSFARAYSQVDAAPIWESYGEGAVERRFISTPARCTSFPYLAIPVAGGVGHDGLSLSVVPDSGPPQRVQTPDNRPGWTTAVLPCPRGPWRLEAVDGSDQAWFAFRPPAEIGGGSAWTTRLLARAPLLLLAGLGLCAAAATLSLTAPSDAPRPAENPAREATT